MPRLRRGRRGRRGMPPQGRRARGGGAGVCSRITDPRAKDACMRAAAERQTAAEMQGKQEMADAQTRGGLGRRRR